jgi:LacI family transcriptional regulator
MPKPTPSLRDIARRLNVSHVTVSLAMRNHPRISVKRREEIQALAVKMGYRPDPMLSSLVAYRNRKRAKPIAAVLAWINRWPDPKELRRHREFDAYWHGAKEAAEELGYRVEEFVIDANLSSARLNSILLTRGVMGLLIPPHGLVGTTWKDFELDWDRFAVVRFGFSAADLRVHMIGNDQMRSAELAVRRMHDLGYRRIGFVSENSAELSTDGNFRMGYLRGLELLGVAALEPLVFSVEGSRLRTVSEELKAWMKRTRPEAILTSVPELHAALQSLGYHLPRDVGLAATSVRDGGAIDAGIDQNALEIGRVAAQTLIGQINRQERGMPEHCQRVLVEGQWVDGHTLPSR